MSLGSEDFNTMEPRDYELIPSIYLLTPDAREIGFFMSLGSEDFNTMEPRDYELMLDKREGGWYK